MTMIIDDVIPMNKTMEVMTDYVENVIHVLSDRQRRQIPRKDEHERLVIVREFDGGGHFSGGRSAGQETSRDCNGNEIIAVA